MKLYLYLTTMQHLPFSFLQDENDVYILTKVSDILHSVFSSYKEKVLPWFEQLLQLIVQLIVSSWCFILKFSIYSVSIQVYWKKEQAFKQVATRWCQIDLIHFTNYGRNCS